MLDIVSLRLSFVLGICIGHMLQCLCPLQQIIVHHFFDSLNGKNQIIQAQVVKVLFFFCKYSIVFKHCFISIFDISP